MQVARLRQLRCAPGALRPRLPILLRRRDRFGPGESGAERLRRRVGWILWAKGVSMASEESRTPAVHGQVVGERRQTYGTPQGTTPTSPPTAPSQQSTLQAPCRRYLVVTATEGLLQGVQQGRDRRPARTSVSEEHLESERERTHYVGADNQLCATSSVKDSVFPCLQGVLPRLWI